MTTPARRWKAATARASAMHDFLIRALVAGLAIALLAGPLGCFVVWRHMSFFGATIAHSALIGVAAGIALGIGVMPGMFAVGGAVALMLVFAGEHRWLATDALLSIVAHGALALGVIVLAFLEGVRVDLMGYLFGDILAVGPDDVVLVVVGAAVGLAVLAAIWRPLLRVTIHTEMAAIEGVPVLAVRIAFMLLLAGTVAMALKVVGILLVTSLLVIPAATARRFAATPEGMAALAAALGVASVFGGMGGSVAWDLPAGPAIVTAAAILFLAALVWPSGLRLGPR